MNLIPKPQHFKKSDDFCNLSDLIFYHIDKEISQSKDVIYSILKLGLKRDLEEKKGCIDFLYNRKIPKEGYNLNIYKDGIRVEASDYVGALYAAQSLRILGEFDLEEPVLECCEIEDYPEYPWRGLLYDESRHFYGVNATKRLIDLMSLHKLNVLHWHLSDDQGWRIEIKKYPRLVEIGSKREQSQINGWRSTDGDGIPVSGYYTQDEIRDIIEYAGQRGIMIIPEIDMPGHFGAALAAYNDLACRALDRPVPWYFGGNIPMRKGIFDWNRPACVSNPKTMEFIYDVIDEVCALFPAPYFHVGGDEAPMGEWKTCPSCQALMKKKGFTNVKQLQCNFINEIKAYVEKKNKRLIGWNEALKGDNLDSNVIIQYWTYMKDNNVPKHLKNGGEIILSKHQNFYFDMPYSQYQLKNTFNFSIKGCGLDPAYRGQIKGVEGAMWTEWIPDVYKFDFHLFPRLEALAEVAWNANSKNYGEFLNRLASFKPILKALKVNYAENSICDEMGFFKKYKYKSQWYHGNQNLELEENKKIKISKEDD